MTTRCLLDMANVKGQVKIPGIYKVLSGQDSNAAVQRRECV